MKSKQQRNYSLDFLRVIATILILLHHYQQLTSSLWSNHVNFARGKFYFGYVVEFFFLLSGFVIEPYRNKLEEGTSFEEFMKKRVIRLVPVLAVSVVIYEVLSCIYGLGGGTDWYFDTNVNIWGLL